MSTPQLSSEAEAILHAYQNADLDDELSVAAVLRAAAIHLHSEEYETCGGCSYSLMVDVDDLLAVAKELEAFCLLSDKGR